MGPQILLTEFYLADYDSSEFQSLLTEQERVWNEEGTSVTLSGRFQHADLKNGNGRIYPLEILQREIQNYQQLIKESRAIGELNHPECIDINGEILAEDGWKFVKDLQENEKVYTLNLETNKVELQVAQKLEYDYNGKMILIEGKTIRQCITPNHRMLICDRNKNKHFMDAENFYDSFHFNKNDIFHSSMTRKFDWEGAEPEFFEIAGQKVPSELWMAFMGIWLSEGWASTNLTAKRKRYKIFVCQKKKEQTDKIRKEIFDLMPFNYQEVLHKSGKTVFSIENKEFWKYFVQFGKASDKFISTELKNCSPRLLNILLDWMLVGDGLNKVKLSARTGVIRELSTTSKKLAEDTSEIMFKIGFGGSISVRIPKNRQIEGREILAINSKPLYIIHEHSVENVWFTKTLKVEKVDYNDKVYCVRVPNQTWLYRNKGATCWTGNSPTIDLERTSHVVTHLEMRGKEVVGKLRLLNDMPMGTIAKSLYKNKIKFGVSSRALGSVKEVKDSIIVQDDLQLICFDLVSDPSTPGAFLNEQKKLFMREQRTKEKRIQEALKEVLVFDMGKYGR